MKKCLFLGAVFFSVFIPVFADKFTSFDDSIINQVMDFRFNARSYESPDRVIKETKAFHKQMLEPEIQQQLSSEAKITVENILNLVEYSAMYEKDPQNPELKPFILHQYKLIEEWNNCHPAEQANPYYTLTAGDVINSSMQFLPQTQAIKLGLEEKKNYNFVIEQNPDFSFGYINTALWYYYAPAIGGGSSATAKEYLEKAVNCAKSLYEKFYSNIYLSQFFFEKKDMNLCEKYLSEAEKLLPSNRYTAFIRKINKINYSILFYNSNREKVDTKLKSLES